ncbi:hypothetical protein [Psychrobacter phenylpyruvicus]|uniref:Uncharacterized protein n=1 Tax=Psychrobacter phenylpyruvicus TaxID=29432 RepID=A0A379LK65_9GAMM|nr:hypothetical protein [Psychrobacter phenylpyruvicus]SUD91009.1 Uncharacterised protein [Psychrobacter phenylpyruvicus]
MSDFWQQLLGTLAGNTLLIGLAGFIGKVYIERIARKDQASIDTQAREHTTELEKRIKLLEQDHEKLLAKNEHFHRISQETYQRLFEMKVKTYKELIGLKLDYETPVAYDIYQIDFKGVDNRDFLIFKKFQKIISHIDNNALYITPSLLQEVNSFKSEIVNKIYDLEDEIKVNSEFASDQKDIRNLEIYEAKEYSKIYKETKNARLKVIQQIDSDILNISHYIHGDTL